MKIEGYTSVICGNPWKNWLFLRLETDSGIVGFGEASLNGFARTVETAISELQHYFVGRSPFQINNIARDMLSGVYSDGGQIHRAAIAAVEVACWDIVGKSVGQPLWNLWGGQVRDRIRLYANGWYQDERTPEAFAKSAMAVVQMGYTAMKFDPFGAAKGGMDTSEHERSLDVIKAVRESVSDDVDLMIEGHCRFDVSTALVLARELEEIGVAWFEEPVSYQNLKGLVEVASRSPIKIATGENFVSVTDFNEICQGSQNFVLQPDYANLGGIKASRQVCELAESLEMQVAPHDAQGPMSKAVCLQLCALSPSILIQEDFEEFNPDWTRSVASSIEKTDGVAKIPDTPGLGRTLRWETLSEHPYDEAATLSLYESGWEQRSGRSSE